MKRYNLFEDSNGAARVRSVAEGNETVPTVFVGNVALVNPTVSLVKKTVAEHAPHLLSE